MDAPELTREQAHEVCLGLLAVRPRSRHELGRRLAGRGCGDGTAQHVLDRLEAVGLVDDDAFAQEWVRARHSFSGKGRRALGTELRAKGVADEIVRAALEQVDDDDERERAVELVRRKLRSTTIPTEPALRAALTRRLGGMLARRGYPPDVARSVVANELERDGAPPDGLD